MLKTDTGPEDPTPAPHAAAGPLSSFPLAIGTWSFGDDTYWEGQRKEDSAGAVTYALGHGIRHIDTAARYGNGKAEQLVGQLVRRRSSSISREELVIATKVSTYDPGSVEKRVRTSLARLQTDYLDIVYLHWPKSGVDIIPVYRELARLKQAGLLRFIGATNLPAPLLRELHAAVPLDIFQTAYSLLWRKPEDDIIPFCREAGITLAAYSPLAQGLLSREDAAFTPEDPRNRLVPLRRGYIERTRAVVSAVSEVSGETGKSMAQVAIDWIARKQSIDTTILGCRDSSQLSDLLAAHDEPLTDEQMGLLDSVSGQTRFYEEDNIFGHTW